MVFISYSRHRDGLRIEKGKYFTKIWLASGQNDKFSSQRMPNKDVPPMLAQCWFDIEPTLGERLVFARWFDIHMPSETTKVSDHMI